MTSSEGPQTTQFSHTLPWKRSGKLGFSRRTFSFMSTSSDHLWRLVSDRRSFYEHDLLLHLYFCGPRGGLYVDVGANVGNHSVFFAAYLADTVLSVEPESEIFELLRSNLERNLTADELSNVVVKRCALSSQEGWCETFLPKAAGSNLGMTQMRVCSPGAPNAVRMCKLDALVEECRLASAASWQTTSARVSLLKIDVEGHQAAVLEGAKSVLDHDRPDVVIEAPSSEELAEVEGILLPLGYHQVGKFCLTPTYHYVHRESATSLKTPPLTFRMLWKLSQSRPRLWRLLTRQLRRPRRST